VLCFVGDVVGLPDVEVLEMRGRGGNDLLSN